jgi:hypothetical protein
VAELPTLENNECSTYTIEFEFKVTSESYKKKKKKEEEKKKLEANKHIHGPLKLIGPTVQ